MTLGDRQPQKIVFNETLLKSFAKGQLAPAMEDKVAAFVEARPELLDKAVALSGASFLEKLKAVRQRSALSQGLVEAVAVAPSNIDPDPMPWAKNASALAIPSELANYSGYRVIKELGRGGMGVVYLAKNIQMDRLEVLKVLSERLLDHEGAKERFLREIRAVSKLNHPNIVTSYSILPLENLLVFAMEHVHGLDLNQFVHKHTHLPVGLACAFARQIAAGLQHAHEKGLVHRDIKPSNAIVYKADGQLMLKILDFGLAKATSEKNQSGLTQDGMMLGTPEYMSPEQTLNASQADIRADIYSLGCTLYMMLTGHPPFRGTHGEVLLAHAQRDAQQVSLVRPEVPVELSAIVAKMMAKDARKRYQTPADVHSALKPFLGPVKLSTGSAANAAESNTVNDLASPSRDTSVEEPAPELSLTPAHSLASEVSPQQQIATLMADHRKGRTTNRYRRRPKPANWIRRNLLLLGLIAGALFAGMFWLGTVTFRTPDGTIVVENLPPDADILIDGKRLAIQWSAGKDQAEISVAPGKRQVEVRSKGLKVVGESVELAANETEVIRVEFQVTPPPARENPPLSVDEKTDASDIVTSAEATSWDTTPPDRQQADNRVSGRTLNGNAVDAEVLSEASFESDESFAVGRTRELASHAGSVPSAGTTVHKALEELNFGSAINAYPWLTDNGLTIYWTQEDESASGSEIWQASRRSVASNWENIHVVARGRQATVANDNRLMILLIDGLLHSTVRNSSEGAFNKPILLHSLKHQANPKSPWLSADGAELVFQRLGDNNRTEFAICRRDAVIDHWDVPQELRMMSGSLLGDTPTWPHLRSDKLMIWFSNKGDRTGDIVVGSRSSITAPFGNYHRLEFMGVPIVGRAPRYVETTGELFYSRPVGEKGWELWVMRDGE